MLRKIEKTIDFGFIYEEVKGLYSEDIDRHLRGQTDFRRCIFFMPKKPEGQDFFQ